MYKYSKQLLSVELSTFHTNPPCLYALDEIALVGRNGSDATRDLVPEIIDSGPMCVTDIFQNTSVAYFNPK